MPVFTVPASNGEDAAPRLREYNQCHNPAGGPTGGQFCSQPGSGGKAARLAAAIAIVRASENFDPLEAARAAGPAFEARLHEILDAAPAAQRYLQQGLQTVLQRLNGRMVAYAEMTTEPGIVGSLGPIKSARRIVEKALIEEEGQLGSGNPNEKGVKDLVRASIAVDAVEDVSLVLQTLKRRLTVVRVKDKFKTPQADGYRDVLVNIRTPEGVLGEVQIHLKPILRAKEGAGHRLLEQMRRLIGVDSPAARATLAALAAESASLYSKAWRQALAISAAVMVGRGAIEYMARGRFV